MTTLQTVSTLVQGILGRPDQSALVDHAVKAMVSKAHSADLFKKDLVESTLVTVSSPANKVSFALPTRFREFSFVMQTDAYGAPFYAEGKSLAIRCDLDEFQYIDELPAQLRRTVVGLNCQVYNPIANINYLMYAHYVFPDVSSMSNTTWLLDLPVGEQAIIDGACYYVRQKLGDTEGMRVEQQFWSMWLATIVSLNIAI